MLLRCQERIGRLLIAWLGVMLGVLLHGCSSSKPPVTPAHLPQIPEVPRYEGSQEIICDHLTTAVCLPLDEPSIEIAYFYVSRDREWGELVESFSAVLGL